MWCEKHKQTMTPDEKRKGFICPECEKADQERMRAMFPVRRRTWPKVPDQP